MFIEKVAHAKTFVAPERLLQVESSSKYHSYWTYYKISIWKDTKMKLDVKMWELYEKYNSYYPKMSDMKSTSNSLLNMIRCVHKLN